MSVFNSKSIPQTPSPVKRMRFEDSTSDHMTEVPYENEADEIDVTLLLEVIEDEDTKQAEDLPAKNVNINSFDKNGEARLLRDLKLGNPETVKFLLDKGADVTLDDANGVPPLHHVLGSYQKQGGTTELLYPLLEYGADVNVTDSSGATSLHKALEWGNIETVEYLLYRGADVNVVDKNGDPPLFSVFNCEDERKILHLCNILFRHGVHVSVTDSSGATALHKALEYGNLRIVQYLLDKGADVNIVDKNGDPPLLSAFNCEDERIRRHLLEILLKHGANIKVADSSGATALHKAIECGNSDMLTGINSADPNGSTPILNDFNCSCVTLDIINIITNILEKKGDANASDRNGTSASHRAFQYKELDIIKFILECTSEVNKADSNGKTSFIKIVLLLLEISSNFLDHVIKFEKNMQFLKHLVSDLSKTTLRLNTKGGSMNSMEVSVEKKVISSGQPFIQYSTNIVLIEKDIQVKKLCMKFLNPATFILLLDHFMVHHLNIMNKQYYGKSSLHIAIELDIKEAIPILLNQNVNLSAVDVNGRTPLLAAAMGTDSVLFGNLHKYGANIHARDNNSQASLHLAVINRNLETVQYLISNSADPYAKDNFGKMALDYAVEVKDEELIRILENKVTEESTIECLDFTGELLEQIQRNIVFTKSDFLLDKLRHVKGEGQVSDREIEKVQQEVTVLLQNIVAVLKKQIRDNCYFTLRQDCIRPIGSCKEKTKIGKPDECDFMVEFSVSDLAFCQEICGLPLAPTGFCFLEPDGNLNKSFVNEFCYIDDVGNIAFSSTKFHQWFWTLVRKITEEEPAIWDGVNNLGLKCQARRGHLDSKSCTTMTLFWTGPDYKDMEIDVDITPSIYFDEVCPLLSPFCEKHPHSFHIVPKPPHQDSTIGLSIENDVRLVLWKIDYVTVEIDMIGKMPPIIRDAYVTCKCVRSLVPPLRIPHSSEPLSAGKVVSSYMMKLMFLKHVTEFLKKDMTLEQMVLEVFTRLAGYLDNEYLPDFWAFEIPYHEEDLSPEMRSTKTPHGYPNVLASSKRDPRDSYKVAKLLAYMVERFM